MTESNEFYYNPKRISRVYINQKLTENENIEISHSSYHHQKNVLRLKQDFFIKIFNEKDGEFLAQVVDFTGKNSGTLKILEKLQNCQTNYDGPTLFFSPVKNTLTQIIQKATELGVSKIFPVITQNTILRKIDQNKLQEISIASSCQSKRLTIAKIENAITIVEMAQMTELNILFCNEHGRGERIFDVAKNHQTGKIAAFIGPEGGFTEEEFNQLNAMEHVTPVTIGPRILRSETAIAAALSIIQTANGDF